MPTKKRKKKKSLNEVKHGPIATLFKECYFELIQNGNVSILKGNAFYTNEWNRCSPRTARNLDSS